jgi:hypothetical protein
MSQNPAHEKTASIPPPARSLSKNVSKTLPQSKKVQYLYRAAVTMVELNPKYASYLGRQCEGEISRCTQPHGLSNAAMGNLCKKCGCPFAEEDCTVVELSKSTVRRSQRRKSRKMERSSRMVTLRGGILCTCRACGNSCPTSKYPTVEVAAEVLNKRKEKKRPR